MINFERTGHGPPVVLVHGITESLRSWDPLVAGLSANFDVVAVDLRGHGGSFSEPPFDLFTMALDIQSLLVELDVERPLMIGHSLGGSVVSAFGAIAPCRGIVNVDQPLRLGEFREGLKALEPALKGSSEEFQAAMWGVLASLRGPLNDSEWSRLNANRRFDQAVVLGIWSIVFDTPTVELDELTASVASTVTVPYLSLHGNDPGDDYAQWLTGLVPTASVELWEERGHYPHLMDQDRFVRRIVDFDGAVTETVS